MRTMKARLGFGAAALVRPLPRRADWGEVPAMAENQCHGRRQVSISDQMCVIPESRVSFDASVSQCQLHVQNAVQK